MARAAFTTSYDEDGPLKRNNEECNEFFYEKRRREMLGDAEDSEELFRAANPSLKLPASPGGPLYPRYSPKVLKKYETASEANHGAHPGALALYQIPKLYAGDIDQPRRLLSLPPVPQEQLKQYAELVANALKPGAVADGSDTSTAALLSYQPLVGFYEKYFFEKRKLGSGGFADVFEAVDKLDGMSYAVKRVRFKSVAHFCRHYNKVLREVRLLARLSHKNVLRYYSAWIEISSTAPPLTASNGSDLLPSARRNPGSTGPKVQEIPTTSPPLTESASISNSLTHSKDKSRILSLQLDHITTERKVDSFWEKSYTVTVDSNITESTPAAVGEMTKSRSYLHQLTETYSDDSGLTTREDFTNTHTGFITKTQMDNTVGQDDTSDSDVSSLSSADESSGFLHAANEESSENGIKDNHISNLSSSSSLEEIVRVPTSARQTNGAVILHSARSPHRAHPHDSSRTPAEAVTFTLYIKTQLYANETLKDWLLRRHSVDASESIRIFRQIIEALAYCHQNNICHRDLKPGNIFCSDDGTVVLGDFGLAKELLEDTSPILDRKMTDSDGNPLCNTCGGLSQSCWLGSLVDGISISRKKCCCDSSESHIEHETKSKAPVSALSTPSLSRHTSRLGTAAYAAPEQISSSGEYSNRVDIFPAGIILFELLSLFSSGHERANAINNLRKGILPSNFVASYPIAAKWIIRMTDPQPEIRPSCTEVLASDLFIVYAPSVPLSSRSDNILTSAPSTPVLTARSFHLSSVADVSEEQLAKIKDTKLLVRIILEQQKLIAELKGQLDAKDSTIDQMEAELKQLERAISSKSPPPQL